MDATEAIGTVKAVTGTAKAMDPTGVERQLQPGDKVYPNETIVTADGGVVLIEFLNGTHLDLPSASQIVLDGEILELATAQSEPLTVEQIQEMIARGEDPAAIAEATAAGGAAGDEGGSSFVVVDFNNTQGNVTSGFNTLGIPTPAFPILEAELPPEDDDGDGDAPPSSPPGDNGVSIVIPGAITVNEANLADGSDPDSALLTQTGTFTISAPDGVNELAIEGQPIISNGVYTPISIVTASGNTIAITGYNPATGAISYAYTLNDNESHAPGNGANVLPENLSVVLTNSDGDIASGSLTVTVSDNAALSVQNTVTESNALMSADTAEAGGNNWLSALALRGNVLGANAAPGDVVAFANLLAVTAAGIDIAGLHGRLHLESSGDYIYTPYGPNIAADGAGAGTATQTVVLEGIDLTANNTLASAMIITNLLVDGNLKTDA